MDRSNFNTIEDVRKAGSHLSLEERGMIQVLHRQGYSLRRIAAEVGCSHTTVFYELRRGTPEKKGSRGRAPKYTAKRGQKFMMNIVRTPESSVTLIIVNSKCNLNAFLL